MTFEEYLKFKAFKPKSVKAHVSKIKKLGAFDQEHVTKYIASLLQRCTNATANKYINTYRIYAKYLIYTGQSKPDDLSWLYKIKHYKECPKQRIIFSDDELSSFFTCHDRYDTYFQILARTGARPMEIASLKKTDIDFANGVLMIQQSKTGDGRTVPIPEDLMDNFYTFLNSHQSEWCFPVKDHDERHITIESLTKSFKARKKQMGLRDALTPYCFRHTFVTRMLGADIPLFVVQSIVGHKRADTTMQYFHLDLKMQKDAVRRDPMIWCSLPAKEKLKVIKDYICRLGLDLDSAFEFTFTNNELSLSIAS